SSFLANRKFSCKDSSPNDVAAWWVHHAGFTIGDGASSRCSMAMVTRVSGAGLSQEQFVVLIARLERRVRSFIATLVGGNRDAIDEIIQSSYLVAWRKLSSFTYLDSTPDEELVRWI